MILLAVWVLLSFLMFAIWVTEGAGGPLEAAVATSSTRVPLTWDLRWAWFILIPAFLILGLLIGGLSSWAELKHFASDMWEVIVLGRRPMWNHD